MLADLVVNATHDDDDDDDDDGNDNEDKIPQQTRSYAFVCLCVRSFARWASCVASVFAVYGWHTTHTHKHKQTCLSDNVARMKTCSLLAQFTGVDTCLFAFVGSFACAHTTPNIRQVIHRMATDSTTVYEEQLNALAVWKQQHTHTHTRAGAPTNHEMHATASYM